MVDQEKQPYNGKIFEELKARIEPNISEHTRVMNMLEPVIRHTATYAISSSMQRGKNSLDDRLIDAMSVGGLMFSLGNHFTLEELEMMLKKEEEGE